MTTAPTLNGQELELFRIGDYGKKGRYTAADIEGIVARYSASGESPIAIGHPEKDSEPAFGWLKSVRFDGEVLHGVPGDVHEVLDTGWKNKMYRNRSAAFAVDPKGQLYLHHVAFLGAVPPVIQGLRDAKFSSDPYNEITFSDTGEDDMAAQDEVKKTVLDTLKEFFSSKDAPTAVAAPLDSAKIAEQVTAAVESKFSALLAAEKSERVRVEAELAAHKATFSAADTKSRAEKAVADLKAAGFYVPAYDHVGVPELFSALAAQTETITFSDASKVEQKRDLVQAFSDVLSSVGKIVPAGQLFSATADNTQKPVADANGANVDAASATFSTMCEARSKEKGIPYTEAYRQLVQEGKRPQSGASAAGAV